MGDDGKAYEGRGWAYQGGHTFRYNDIAVGICAIGNFENEPPSEKLIQTIKQLIACAEEEASIIFYWSKMMFKRNVSITNIWYIEVDKKCGL